MKNTFILFALSFLFSFQTLTAQHTITGKLTPKGENNLMLLYKTEGAFQYYKASTAIDEQGFFVFALPENFETGSYRLVYNTQKDLYVNIIYNNEDISFSFDPENLMRSIYFSDSKENTLFFDYINQINIKYSAFDSVQKLIYETGVNNKLLRAYSSKKAETEAFQNYFEEESKGLIVYDFISAYRRTLSATPFNNKIEYLEFLSNTYLNSIDFKSENLKNSSFIIDRLNEYVFDLNEAIATRKNANLDTKMLDLALEKIEASKFKDEVIYSLVSSAFDPYSSRYDVLLDYIYTKYYKALPESIKNKDFTEMVKSKLNVIVGKKAPNITLGDSSLYQIKSENTLVIFWSTTCSHCLKEIPEVYEMLAENKNYKVVLVGLEESYSDWESVILSFPKWIHLRANGKWDNEYAKSYNVKSTPAYFVLDQNKVITAKPDKLEDMKELFGK